MKIQGFNFLNLQQKRTNNALQDSLRRLSSGRLSSRDNPASNAISESLRAQSRGLVRENEGLLRSQASLQVADGGLSSIGGDLQRLRELAVQAANGSLSDLDRQNLQSEFDQVLDNIDFVSQNTSFGGQKLLDGSFSAQGDLKIENTSSQSLGLSSEGVSTQEAAQDALSAIDAAIDRVASERATVGAIQNRLDFSFEANAVQRENIEAAASRLSDVDLAQEMVNLTQLQIQAKAQIQLQKVQQDIAKTTSELLSPTKKK